MNVMKRRGRAGVLLLAIGAAACGGGSKPPSSSDPPTNGERINGNERLGWAQSASSAAELATFRYAAYVDNNRVLLADVNCGAAGGGFECSSRMPSMSPGAHTIELVSFVDGAAESPRSAPLRVTLAGAVAPADPSGRARNTTEQTTADGIRLSLEVLSDRVESPTALAFSPDGRVFVAERRGQVRIIDPSDLAAGRDIDDIAPALVLDDVLVTGPLAGGLLDVALDSDFARTRLAYVLYTTASADGSPVFKVARYREAGGRLGERIVILDNVPSSAVRPAGAIGIGADRKLYVAFDAADDVAQHERAASYNGKVLRLEPGGATPADQAAGSPVHVSGLHSPRGLEWHPTTGALWVADVVDGQAEELRVYSGASLRARSVALPALTNTAALTFYRGRLLAGMQGDLLVAAGEGHLLRLRFDRRDSTRLLAAERLFDDLPGPATLVSVGPDGAIYLGTDREIYRIGPR
jgi:quinoprotein glucose dehydrogenase